MNGPLLQCVDVTKRYGDMLAVDNVSLELEPGEILSILGPSGCGKTTLLRLIAGFENLDSGEISIQGKRISGLSNHVSPDRRNVGMVFQEYALFPHMTVAQNVSFGLQRVPRNERRQRLAEVFELVRLTGLDSRYPHELSGGQQQRVALARTLATRPVAMLLDEPFSNLDTRMGTEMRKEVEAILRGNNIATVFVTHNREEAFAMSDRIAVMNEGRIDQIDSPNAIYQSPKTAFVAQMTGTCDFLRCRFRDGVAVTEIGKLKCVSNNGTLDDDCEMDLLVHPDDFRVVPDPNGSSEVLSREFRGDETMLVVRTPSGDTLRCRQRSYSPVTPGTKVSLIPIQEAPFLVFRRP